MVSMPVRCFTCVKVVSDKLSIYLDKQDKGENPPNILDDLGFRRFCCRRMFLSYPRDYDDKSMLYPSVTNISREKNLPALGGTKT